MNKIIVVLQELFIYLASLQYIDIELEDIEYLYNCNQEDVKDVLEQYNQSNIKIY